MTPIDYAKYEGHASRRSDTVVDMQRFPEKGRERFYIRDEKHEVIASVCLCFWKWHLELWIEKEVKS